MVKENYPVRPETLDEGDIEHFEILPDILQEYLLYVRYTAILIYLARFRNAQYHLHPKFQDVLDNFPSP
jgi:hypothetical protein